MSQTSQKPPRIPAIPADGRPRPFWSVMIPAYNPRKDHLEKNLGSVLAQDPGREQMQIEVVDDCSPKVEVAALVREIAGDRVNYSRTPKNLGLAGCWNTCIERSRGEWVHILHQDDYVLPGFYQRLASAAKRHPDVSLLTARTLLVDGNEIIVTVTKRLPELENGGRTVDGFFYDSPIQCAGVAVRRTFYEEQGGFLDHLVFLLDREMWVRAISCAGGAAIPEALSCYRVGNGSETGRLTQTAESLRDMERLNQIFSERYPTFDQKSSPAPLQLGAGPGRRLCTKREFRSGGGALKLLEGECAGGIAPAQAGRQTGGKIVRIIMPAKSIIMDDHVTLRRPKPCVVVVTPTKNEAAIIGRFLACCTMFADRIVLLDQNSTDDTIAIAKQFPKVEAHLNLDSDYSEQSRQKRLLELARKGNAERLVILALDADEIPTASILTSPEWRSFLDSAPGTVLCMPRLEILPGMQQVLVHHGWPFGYVDDGADHGGKFMHSIRIPMPPNRTELVTSQVRVLHYSFVRPELQAAKNRFYCIKENLSASRSLMERRALYRYDFIENRIRTMKGQTLDHDWIAAYEAQGIDMTSIVVEHPSWFDREVEADMVKWSGVPFHFDPVWNYSFDSVAAKNKRFRRPPKGLARCLAIMDRLYAACPLKRPFAQMMEIVFKAYVFCRR